MAESAARSVDLAGFVHAIGAEDLALVDSSKAEATELVENFIGGLPANPFNVPDTIIDRAVLEVGADLFYRQQTRNGIAGFDGATMAPARINRDPMAAAYPLLRQYIPVSL